MDTTIWLEMFERVSVLTTFAFILSHTTIVQRMVSRQVSKREWWLMTGFFGVVGIVGSFAGIPVDGALANSRTVGVMAAGLIGGPAMGLAVAAIGGTYRCLLGGFTAWPGVLSNLIQGLLAGLINRSYPGRPIPWWGALITGLIGESAQMGILLLIATPHEQAVVAVSHIAMPMISVNSLGIAIFMFIIKSARDAQERVGSQKAHKVLEIATKTLPYLRRGLNRDSAQKTAEIIYRIGGYDAVAITNTEEVLAFAGAGEKHHAQNRKRLTQATRLVLDTGTSYIAQTRAAIGCCCVECELASAIVVPLKQGDKLIGALKLYYIRPEMIGDADTVFAEGVADLFSTQLELTEIDRQAKLASKAELKALYAQINPHFLFNTLNTIASLVRTEPEVARGLLGKLGALFRITLQKAGKNITIEEELVHVRAYLSIEKARHGDKLIVEENIAAGALKYLLPSLTIQPLVENAIKHGLQPKEDGGRLRLAIAETAAGVEIAVEDDGIGIDLIHSHPLLKPAGESIGLVSVHERLCGLYGQGLEIFSNPGQGTKIVIRLPKEGQKEGEDCT